LHGIPEETEQGGCGIYRTAGLQDFDGARSQVRDCLHPRDLVPALVRQLGGETPQPADDGIDLPWAVLDSGRAGRLWGWKPVTPVESILAEIAG
jgi:CDP-paratose 2-epimerase